MKKLFALLLAVMMLCVSVAALAEAPEGYPEVKDIDFGGATLYLDYYWNPDPRKAEPTQEEQDRYDFQDWIQETYNVNIVEEQWSDWGGISTELVNFVGAPDGSLRAVVLPPDFVGGPMANGALAAWNGEGALINLEDDFWNDSTVDFMTKSGVVYGVTTGHSEPRGCLYFNKAILEAAGIDWNTVYDMQADGTWTWEAFEDMLKQIQKDTDNDGVIDIWGFTGENITLQRNAVFGNGGSFFDYDDEGKLVITAGSDNALEALAWAKDIWENYAWKGEEGANWDYYKDAWKQNFCGFYMYQTYGGFNDQHEFGTDMDDGIDWGVVAVPVGPKGDTYVNVVSDNVWVIPNVYDAETTAKIAYIYSLWHGPVPGYEDDDDAWIGNKYNYTDERGVDETYAMLREPEHCAADKCLYLGSINDVEGSGFLWELPGSTPAELLESKTPVWQGLLDAFNGK